MAKRGRPKIEIDLEQVEKLGMLQCTYSECGAWFGVHESTLKKNPEFITAYKKGSEKGKISLRRKQFKLAEKNTSMAIWLGKQYLGQREPTTEQFTEDESELLKKIAKVMQQ